VEVAYPLGGRLSLPSMSFAVAVVQFPTYFVVVPHESCVGDVAFAVGE
jgi:hypothetical protein